MCLAQAHSKRMKSKGDLAPPAPARAWTGIDDYLGALARRRTARRARDPGPRTTPEAPRFVLSTLPFLVLFGALAVIAAGLFVAAWPGSNPAPAQPRADAQELGTAAKGWLDDAEREFRNAG
jgi:hypothetical protein